MSFDPIPLEPAAAPATPNAKFRPVPVSGVGAGGAVDSVNGQTGEVVIATGDIAGLEARLTAIESRLDALEV